MPRLDKFGGHAYVLSNNTSSGVNAHVPLPLALRTNVNHHYTRGIALTALLIAPLAVLAQRPPVESASPWPNKPVKLIVPFTSGGPTDVVARLMADKLRSVWKQAVVIDYKPGGGTVVGTQFVAKAAPDGYTLGMAITAHMINPSLQPNLPYDTKKDLAGVSQIALAHFGLFAHPSLPVGSVTELIAYAKSKPGELNYATPGVATGTHLAGEMLNHLAGIRMLHVPYKGSSPAQQDVIGGRVPILFDLLFSAMPFVKDKRLKVIALSSPKRAASNPEIPLISDVVPGFSAMSIIGVIVPAGVPRDLVRRMGADIGDAVRSREMNERMVQLGLEPVGSSPEEYDTLIRTEIDKWSGVVKSAGIKIE
ncbi:MAG: tripartite tricarboxylate transporter substrate binding protein [Betaproteobacteria bacterium]|nr:tripartite tricarboxylate transporter substrate binding protein [Betaproteobacteria bacterium]MBI2959921.1 tripartite tricarboxylate transporter substrate binding protein [Betaproteobacteria bacterium]